MSDKEFKPVIPWFKAVKTNNLSQVKNLQPHFAGSRNKTGDTALILAVINN